ncbi:Ulp1 family isopeptidase [Sinorhizobium sp. PC2]|uniref:Ulp1 family isopeptidase n=1 Tax=Ensifer aridi TaxID=1708715 RepID=UPI001F409BAC
MVGRAKEPLYAKDALLISGLKEALLRGGAAESTATSNVGYLLSLGRWLFANDKPGIADRLHDESMDKDAEEFITKRGTANVRWALAHLRTSQSTGGVVPTAGRADLTPYPEDLTLIKKYKKQAVTAGTSSTAKTYATVLTDFSHYQRANNKPGLAARLHAETWNEDESLTEEIKRYKDAGGHKSIGAALVHLREGARKLDGPPLHSEDAPLIAGLQDALVKAGYKEITAKTNYVRPLRRFSRWLFANNKPRIAARLNDESLRSDAAMFDKSRKRLVLTALDRLRASQSADGVASITDRAGGIEAKAKQGGSQPAFSWPAALSEGDDQDLFLGTVDEVGASSCLPDEDASLIEGLAPSLIKAGASERTVRRNVLCLRRLGHWLVKNEKPGIAGRLYDKSLDEDAQEFCKQEGQAVATPLDHLRASQSPGGIAPFASRVELNPYPQDADLIKRYKKEAAPGTANTTRTYATILIDVSDYLRENDKPGIADRLGHDSLVEDVNRYKEANSDVRRKAGAALAHLLKSPAGARAMELRRHIRPVQSPRHGLALDPVEVLRPLNWRHHDHELTDERHKNTLVPGEQILISDEQDTGELISAKRQKTLSNSQGVPVERQLMQTPSHQLGASSSQRQARMPSHALEYAPAAHPVARHVRGTARQHNAVRDAVSWPLVLSKSHAQNQPSVMVEGSQSWSVLVPPEQLQGAVHPGPQEPAGPTSTWLPQMPPDFDWSIWPSSETAPSLPVPAQLPSRSYQLRDDATFPSTLNKLAPGSLPWPDELIGKQLPAEDAELLAKFRLDAEQRKITPGAIKNSVSGVPHPEDAPLIKAALGQVLNDCRNPTAELRQSVEKQATRLCALSAWLRANGRGTITGRLNGSSKEQLALDNDVVAFQRTGGRVVGADLSHLRSYLKLIEANRELGLQAREWRSSPAAQGDRHSGSAQHLPSTPASSSTGVWAWLGEQMQEPASPSRPSSHAKGRLEPSVELNAPTELRDDAHFAPAHPARARSDTYSGLEPFVDLNAPTPTELRDDAHFAPAHPARARSDTYSGLESFVDLNAPTPSELRDDAHFAPAHPSRARSDTYSGLESFVDLNAPTPSELRDDAHFAPAHPSRARSDTYNGLESFVDLNAPTPSELRDEVDSAPVFPSTSSDPQIGALGPTASSHDRNGRVLGGMEWLGDEHILRDYALLRQELQRDNPDLAARTQFVDPLIALYQLRFGEESDMLVAWQRIIYDRHDNDTADFLFLPVNDAPAPNRRGSHWSLLFVDRRERARPIAYHYDSILGHNDQPAAQLAQRLGAPLESARMAQQQNSYDCGVFVVDGTRALVSILAQEERPEHEPLHLDNLVADRQGLLVRLRTYAGLD